MSLIDRSTTTAAATTTASSSFCRLLLCALLEFGQGDRDDRVERSVGPHQARIRVQLAPLDQSRLQTLRHTLAKEPGEDFRTPAPPRLGEHAVIGDLVFQAVTQKPKIIDAQRNDPHQLPLAPHIIPEEQQHHSHHDHRSDRDIPLASVGTRHLLAHEIQLDRLPELAQRVIRWNPPGQVHRLTPQFVLPGMPSHHGTTALSNPSPLGYFYFLTLRFGQQALVCCYPKNEEDQTHDACQKAYTPE